MASPEYTFLQVVTTVASREVAETIARALITQRLAGCVQVHGPIESCYRWEGKVEVAVEWVCTIKTDVHRFPQLRDTLRELHPYDVPEILATPVVAGNEDYLRWLAEQLPDEP